MIEAQCYIVAYLDSVQARLASLRELQSASGEELSALLPSVLDRAFKGAMTSSVLRTSSPIGEDSALEVLCSKSLSADMKW